MTKLIKVKKPKPLASYVWFVYCPKYDQYLRVRKGSRARWSNTPYAYTNDTTLMVAVEYARKCISSCGECQVIPYGLATEHITGVDSYGV
jgi:hypothetical protein